MRAGDADGGARPRGRQGPCACAAVVVVALWILAAVPLVSQEQEPEPPPDRWSFEVELGGSVFFGNRPQSHLLTKAEITSEYPIFESQTRLEFSYGEAEDGEGVVHVNRRSWTAEHTVDLVPQGTVRPFVSGGVESSLERRIDRRYDTGIGVKLDRQANRDNRVEFSLALLGERTEPRVGPGEPPEINTLARWSSTARVRKTFLEDRLKLDLRGEYKPVFDAFGNYVWTSQNAVTVVLTQIVSLRLNTKLQHDSRAEERGARTNRDGQVSLALAATF